MMIIATYLTLAVTARIAVATTYTFAALGDMNGDQHTKVAKMIHDWNPDYIVTTGDHDYSNQGNNDWSGFDEVVGKEYHDWIYNYPGKYGAGSDVRRFFPTLGDHDVQDDWVNGSPEHYRNFFSIREGEKLPGGFEIPEDRDYYTFKIGSIQWFVVNFMPMVSDPEDGWTAESDMQKWLRNETAASDAKFKFVTNHRGVFGDRNAWVSNPENGKSEFMKLDFKGMGIDVVWYGHDHGYHRIIYPEDEPDTIRGNFKGQAGLIGILTSGGGAPVYLHNYDFPGIQSFANDHGAVRGESGDNYVKIEYYLTSNLEEPFDSMVIVK
eukprot:CFRG6759T1